MANVMSFNSGHFGWCDREKFRKRCIGDPNLVSVVPEDVPAFNIRESKLLVKFTHNFYQYNSNIHSKTSFLHIHYKACKCYVKNMGMYMMKINWYSSTFKIEWFFSST